MGDQNAQGMVVIQWQVKLLLMLNEINRVKGKHCHQHL